MSSSALADTPEEALGEDCLQAALAGDGRLGHDQVQAVAELCGPGGLLRALIAPAGFGKTTAIHAAALACTADGRPVLGLATTNQAVAGLQAVGIEAVTIARLRLDLAARRLAPGSVVILDEVSQVATGDAAVVLDAVATTPRAQLSCLGDPRQSQPVGAAGLAAEIARLASDGAIVAPALVVNRRQRDVVDQAALAKLRDGHAQASQAMRTGAGWEHEEATPLATRQALADAVVADIATHGAPAIAALAVSHVDCEDLADRIRARLIAAGHIATEGDELVGPGWGSGERHYAVGDRVLLHTRPGRAGGRFAGLHNGSTGTIVAVSDEGLRVAFDNDRATEVTEGLEVVLSRSFVQGTRGDGHPNLSHAWARTIEGAQGGTWESVHLLGSANLDALVGYTGQSRGHAPTHTWNARPLVVVDHGGELADERSATEVALAGLEREPVTTFAAADDPGILDRRLGAERDEHQAVLAAAPPDLRSSLEAARDCLRQARFAEEAATKSLARAQDRLAGFGPLTGLRRSGRHDRENAVAWTQRASHDLEQATARRSAAEGRVADLEYSEAARADFVAEHSWRADRIKAIDAELSRHWADAVLASLRQDDPLAFGIDRLRAARASYADQIIALDASLPEDRTQAVERERQRLALRQRVLREARFTADQERRSLDAVSQRRWGRRDNQAVAAAQRGVEAADAAVVKATEHESDCRRWLGTLLAAQGERSAAMAANEPQREALVEALGELDAGLDDTRAARVAAMVTDVNPPEHLVAGARQATGQSRRPPGLVRPGLWRRGLP